MAKVEKAGSSQTYLREMSPVSERPIFASYLKGEIMKIKGNVKTFIEMYIMFILQKSFLP